MATSWYPSKLFNNDTPVKPYAIIILNQPINVFALNAVINGASLLVCADAGGDQLLAYDAQSKRQLRAPDAIVGDLDSLSAAARSHYEDKGVEIVHDFDQESTDFCKCLKWIRSHWDKIKSPEAELDVVALGGLGGRVDQGFSQIHHLYLAQRHRELLFGRIYLLSEKSLSFILDEGVNEIHIDEGTFRENVGIIPMHGMIKITTKGFEWDITDWETEFGGKLSTSNHIRSDLLSIDVNGKSPLFTLELDQRLSLAGA